MIPAVLWIDLTALVYTSRDESVRCFTKAEQILLSSASSIF